MSTLPDLSLASATPRPIRFGFWKPQFFASCWSRSTILTLCLPRLALGGRLP
jgi:hypothetical protein